MHVPKSQARQPASLAQAAYTQAVHVGRGCYSSWSIPGELQALKEAELGTELVPLWQFLHSHLKTK